MSLFSTPLFRICLPIVVIFAILVLAPKVFKSLDGVAISPAAEQFAAETPDAEDQTSPTPTSREEGVFSWEKDFPPAEPKQQLITISRETTYFIGPVTEAGYINYVAALNYYRGEGVTPDENFIVALLDCIDPDRIVGVAERDAWTEEKKQAMRDRFYERLGVDEPERTGEYLVFFDEAAAEWTEGIEDEDERQAKNEAYWNLYGEPWKAEDWPEAAKWVEENSPMLDKIGEAALRPTSFWPYDEASGEQPGSVIAILLPFVQDARSVARSLATRVYLRIGEGDFDGAFEDIQTMRRMARHVAARGTLVEMLVGYAIDGIAMNCMKDFIEQADLTSAEAKKLAEEYVSLPPFPPVSESIGHVERAMFLDVTAQLASSGGTDIGMLADGGPGDAPSPLKAVLSAVGQASIDWDTILRRANSFYDKMAVAMDMEDRVAMRERLNELDEKIQRQANIIRDRPWLYLLNPRDAGTNALSTILMSLLCPAISAVADAETRTQMNETLVVAALALEAYRADKGEYSASLFTLQEGYAEELPEDLYVGVPMQYHRTENGYVLYSVGRNCEDEGGMMGYNEDRSLYGDDWGIILPRSDDPGR